MPRAARAVEKGKGPQRKRDTLSGYVILIWIFKARPGRFGSTFAQRLLNVYSTSLGHMRTIAHPGAENATCIPSKCAAIRMARPHNAGGRLVRPLRAQPLSSEKYIQCSTSCVTCAHLPLTLGGPLLAHMKTYIQCNISCAPCACLPIIWAGCSVRPKIVHVYKKISISIFSGSTFPQRTFA